MGNVTTFIQGLPKAELHVHIEGTLEPGLMFDLASKNGVSLPYASPEDLRKAYAFRCLQDFLDLYYQGTGVLRQERDFVALARAYCKRAHAQNVRHVEVSFDPQAHTARGVPFSAVIKGLHSALDEASRIYGLSWRLIMCFLRHLDVEDAIATLNQALEYRDLISAVGLDSTEIGHPPSKFREVFKRARHEGFRAVAHAGEEGPARYVREALTLLCVERIDHGNRATEDDALIAQLADRRVALTLCPLSNLRLGVIECMEDHPIREMLEEGLLVTVNSDDPAYFGGYVNENLTAVAEALSLRRDQLAQLARNSFVASFLKPNDKLRLIKEVDTFVSA
jgi:adenosine deaminase|tara:strand:+ start:10134 stop:11144 length:1011 start_codon:yes stop_codon:yes gene_type:complete